MQDSGVSGMIGTHILMSNILMLRSMIPWSQKTKLGGRKVEIGDIMYTDG